MTRLPLPGPRLGRTARREEEGRAGTATGSHQHDADELGRQVDERPGTDHRGSGMIAG